MEIAVFIPTFNQRLFTGFKGHHLWSAHQFFEHRGRHCPFQQMRSLNPRKGKWLTQGHSAPKLESQCLCLHYLQLAVDKPGESGQLHLLTSLQTPDAPCCRTQNVGHRRGEWWQAGSLWMGACTPRTIPGLWSATAWRGKQKVRTVARRGEGTCPRPHSKGRGRTRLQQAQMPLFSEELSFIPLPQGPPAPVTPLLCPVMCVTCNHWARSWCSDYWVLREHAPVPGCPLGPLIWERSRSGLLMEWSWLCLRDAGLVDSIRSLWYTLWVLEGSLEGWVCMKKEPS